MTDVTDKCIRSILLKEKQNADYLTNAKSLAMATVSDLQATLMYAMGIEGDTVPGDVADLNKDGLVNTILHLYSFPLLLWSM